MAIATAIDGLEINADQAARFLKLFANEQRLLILCQLVSNREMTVNDLAEAVGLSQSALSQHLSRLRADGLVTFRREAQTLRYRVVDPKAVRLLKTLKLMFCP
jgi:DNA-binding transcriptional ArsR family regulator